MVTSTVETEIGEWGELQKGKFLLNNSGDI